MIERKNKMKFKLEVSETFKKVIEIEASDLTSAVSRVCKTLCEGSQEYTLEDRAGFEVKEYK